MFYEWKQWSHQKIELDSVDDIQDLLDQLDVNFEVCGKEYTIGGTYYHVCKLFITSDSMLGLQYTTAGEGGDFPEDSKYVWVYTYSGIDPSFHEEGDAIIATLYHEGKWSPKYIIETLIKAIDYNPDYTEWMNRINNSNNGLEILDVKYDPENTIVDCHYMTKAYGDGWSRERSYVYKIDGFSARDGGSVREPDCHKFVDFRPEDESYSRGLPRSLRELSFNGWGGTLLLPWELFTTRKITFNVLEEGD